MKEHTDNLRQSIIDLELLLPRINIRLAANQLEAIRLFLGELAAYNEHTNLVSCADPQLVVREHIADSLSVAAAMQELHIASGSLVDIGSGAGFPGLILAIALPGINCCLIESIGKKCRFLRETAAQLGLKVQVVNERAETAARQAVLRGQFNIATARAVGKSDLVAELALPLLQKGGWLLMQKSKAQVNEEQCRLSVALPVLGGRLFAVMTPNAEALGKDRAIIIIEKVAETPRRYPRTPAQIKRKSITAGGGIQF